MSDQTKLETNKINHHYTIFEKIIKYVHGKPFKSKVRIISIAIMFIVTLVIIAIFSFISYNKPKVRANDNITELPITSEIEQDTAPKPLGTK